MKPSSWFWGGVAATVLAGLAFLLVGLFKPGASSLPEGAGETAKPYLAEAKKKADATRKAREATAGKTREFAGLKGAEGEHRVFVSAQLVYLPENKEPVQSLDRKMKTKDGIEVGWKIQHGLDPADPAVKDEDPDGDGFTNAEEFLAKTDPNQKADSPAKESKLKSRSGDPVGMAVSFPEKSGGLYSIRFQVGNKRREFKGKPGDSFWVMAGPDMVEIFSEEAKMAAARAKAKEAGQNSHAIPVQFVSYQEKMENIRDARAGGVEVKVDNSVVVLERKDAWGDPQSLIFSTPQRPQTLTWDVGDIRLYTPASGGTELGPFRIGESFFYEGKEFAVVGREGRKIQIRNRSEPGKEDLWLPVETPPAATDPGAL